MSVTTTTYTTNSKLITVSGETTPVNIMSAVDTAITGLGWTQYDYMPAGDTTAYDYYNGKVIPSGTVMNNAGSVSTWTVTPATTTGNFNVSISPTSTTSVIGTGFQISLYKTNAPTSGSLTSYITVQNYGYGYVVGDTITFSGSYDTYNGGTQTIVFTVTAVNSLGNIIKFSSDTNLVRGVKYTATNNTGSLTSGTGSAIFGYKFATNYYGYTLIDGATTINGTITNITPATISNEYNPIYTYVYRALCADNINYKYLIIRWDPTKQQFFTSAASGWDLTTKIPVNETYNYMGTFGQGYDLKDCQILVSASQNHFMIWPWIRQSMGLWTAIWEFERVAPEDTAAANNACFAWTNSVLLGKANDSGYAPFIFPSIPYGTNTLGAMLPVTNKGQTSSLGSAYNYTYGWGSSKTIVSAISVDHSAYLMPYGRAYNWSITKTFGAGLDTTTIKLAAGGWPDASGTDTTCLILPLNGGPESAAGSSATNVNLAGRPQNNGYSAYYNVKDMVLIGNTAWLACGTSGIRTYDTTQTAAGGTAVQRSATSIDKIVFDGFRTIYGIYVNDGTGSTTLIRIDTETYNTSTITLAYAAHNIAIDGKFVYVAMNGDTTAPKIAMISRWVTTDGSTGTGFSLVKTYDATGTPTAGFAGTTYISHMFPDNLGSVFSVFTGTGTYGVPSSSMVIGKTSAIGNAQGGYTSYSSFHYNWSNGGSAWWVGFYFDPISGSLYQGGMTHSGSYTQWYAQYYSSTYPTQYYVAYLYSTNTLTATQVVSAQVGSSGSGTTGNMYMGYSYSSTSGTYTISMFQYLRPYKGTFLVRIEQRSTGIGTGYSSPSNTITVPLASNTAPNGSATSATYNSVMGGYSQSTSASILFGYYNDLYTQGTTALRNYGGSVYYVNKLYDMNYTDGTASGRIILKG